MIKLKKVTAILAAVIMLTGTLNYVAQASTYDAFPLEKSQVLAGKIVILDAGHGAETDNVYGNYSEATFALAEVLYVKQNLENLGAKVYLTRPGSSDVYYYDRMANTNIWALDLVLGKYQYLQSIGDPNAAGNISEIQRLKAAMSSVISDHSKATTYFNTPYSTTDPINADLKKIFEYENTPEVYEKMVFVSIHSNASTDTSVNGTTIYYMSNSFKDSQNYYTNYSNESRNIALSKLLSTWLCYNCQFTDRGLATNDFFMIREHNLPSALIETAFHTNASDQAKLSDDGYRRCMANSIASGIQEYFENYRSKEKITPTPAPTPIATSTPKPTAIVTSTPVPATSTPVVQKSEMPTNTPEVSETPRPKSDYYPTDVNGDELINAGDALDILKVSVNLIDMPDENICDVNKDGNVNAIDALLTLKYSAGLLNELNVIKPLETAQPIESSNPTENVSTTETVAPTESLAPTETVVPTETTVPATPQV